MTGGGQAASALDGGTDSEDHTDTPRTYSGFGSSWAWQTRGLVLWNSCPTRRRGNVFISCSTGMLPQRSNPPLFGARRGNRRLTCCSSAGTLAPTATRRSHLLYSFPLLHASSAAWSFAYAPSVPLTSPNVRLDLRHIAASAGRAEQNRAFRKCDQWNDSMKTEQGLVLMAPNDNNKRTESVKRAVLEM